MRVLVVGSGGREHALCWALKASPLCDSLHCLPGNPGIATLAETTPIPVTDRTAIADYCRAQNIDFVVVGPETPLVDGLVDHLEGLGIAAFGPTAAAAILEGSKGFTKDLCAKYGIPTAAFGRFTDLRAAKNFIYAHGAPIVVKADGLAAGKGVTVARTIEEAMSAVDDALLDRRFGEAGLELVIEEFMRGEEVSFFALVDGSHALPFGSAQDYKRVGDGDSGPNTGGMGAHSPAPMMTPELEARIMHEIIEPTVRAMASEGRTFKGVLYAGLMLTEEGPKLIEYNVRFGDPECQVLMLRMTSDLLPALIAARDGELGDFSLRWRSDAAVTVVMAAKGYPGTVVRNTEIRNLTAAASLKDVEIFHAGTRQDGDRLLADGGRVLAVTATGADIAAARDLAYRAVSRIDWPDGFCRSDIGAKAAD